MSIVAALDKVLFFNASSKYSVLRMKTEDSSVPTEARSPYRYHDHLIRFTAVGIELPQTDTVKIEMDGEWKDGKYGLQLQVDHWQEIVPPTLEGVRNYLASGLLKGIGEKTADAIIEKFGVNALKILEHQPDRLLEIRGITKERLAEIKDAYGDMNRSIYCLVQPGGDIDEDDRDSKIACTELTILRQLTRKEFFLHALAYMVDHPGRKMSEKVQREHSTSRNGYAIVRGKTPAACGKLGDMLDWLQREKCSGRIIPDHVLHWLEQEKIHVSDIDFILNRMSEQQVCNYLQRQKSGTRDSLRQIIFTWRDYLSMADKLGINTHDEIVYRVKLLRQRHDELVEQLRKRERDMEAAATARKYRKIAGICRSIKPKYEYTGEMYSIVVPSGVRDIMREGDALSHCVGKSDRYWERIEQQEAYILFLRKTAEIDKPYYTLEVEPNGTIRQKRTYFDRQNDDLKDAEQFLKEWQKVVSERLTESDREKAEKSKVLRLQEFEQLRQDDIRIHTGDLAGQRLVDVLVSDLMETAA